MRRRNDARAAMASSAGLPSLHALSTEAATTGMHWDDDMRDRWAPVRQRTWHNDAAELEHEIARMREERQRQEEEYEEAQRLKQAEFDLYMAEEKVEELKEELSSYKKAEMDELEEAMEETLEAQAPKGWRSAK